MVLKSETLLEHLSGIVHAETQQHTYRVDLTAAAILELKSPGALDFGGSEFRSAETAALNPKKRDPSDDYGWWSLQEGSYRVRFNESFTGPREVFVLLTPHRHLSEAGVVADTLLLAPDEGPGASGTHDGSDTPGASDTPGTHDSPDALPLNFRVPGAGLEIKENARMASLYMLSG